MANARTITEADILAEVIAPDGPALNAEVAQSLLTLTFPKTTTKEIRRLLQKNKRGTISAGERMALEKYLRVGQLLDLLHARVRLALSPAAD
jgi:hypothetical protein